MTKSKGFQDEPIRHGLSSRGIPHQTVFGARPLHDVVGFFRNSNTDPNYLNINISKEALAQAATFNGYKNEPFVGLQVEKQKVKDVIAKKSEFANIVQREKSNVFGIKVVERRGYSIGDNVKFESEYGGKSAEIIGKKKMMGETMYLVKFPSGKTSYVSRDMIKGELVE